MLLDEGTSALDSILKRYDEIIVMNNGNIVEKGSFDELINNKGEFFNLYNIESESQEVIATE